MTRICDFASRAQLGPESTFRRSVRVTRLIVWHDGACPLCQREIALMRRLDRKGAIVFVDASSEDTTCPIDRSALLSCFHAQENGKLLSRAAAFAAMWLAMPALRPLGLASGNPLILAGLESAYRLLLLARPQLQAIAKKVGPGSVIRRKTNPEFGCSVTLPRREY